MIIFLTKPYVVTPHPNRQTPHSATSGAGFTKHLKLKIFISSIPTVWNIETLKLKMFSETIT